MNKLLNGIPLNNNNNISTEDLTSLVKHMILEQTYFVRLNEGNITVADELQFWFQENREHIDLLSHLLPNGELKTHVIHLVNQSFEYPDDFKYQSDVIDISDRTTDIIHNDIHSGRIKSIDDKMLEHEMRETKRGKQRIIYLISNLTNV